MQFPYPLVKGRLVQRYKRFLADIEIGGKTITAHVANPGAMLGNKTPGSVVWVSPANNPKRKLHWDWQLVQHGEHFCSVNTAMPNRIIAEALAANQIAELAAYNTVRPEVKYSEKSRVDFLLTEDGLPDCYLEIKGVSMSRSGGLAEFPDSVTARGAKHMRDLSAMVEAGHSAVLLYLLQRNDCDAFRVAADIDLKYAKAVADAKAAGVEILCYDCHITTTEIRLNKAISDIA